MKILITGNMGYVGPGVVRQLRAAWPDAVLVGVDTGFFAHCLTGAAHLPEAALDVQHFCDVRHLPESMLDGVDAIVHLAAISNDPMGKLFEDVTLDVNFRASVRLAELAKNAGVRAFVFASSCSVYGFADDRPRTESSSVNPLTAYARSKIFTEEAVEKLASDSFQVTCLRFATACGMSDRLRLDLVLNDFVAAACASRDITILSDGTPWRPLINVLDMARAIEWALSRTSKSGGNFLVVNAGSDSWNYRVRDLAEAVASVVPGTKVSINASAPPDKRSYCVDFSLFRRLAPKHQPQFDLVSTVRYLQQGLESMHFSDAQFRSSWMMRLNVLKELSSKGLLDGDLFWKPRTSLQPEEVSAGDSLLSLTNAASS
ncbi:MAG: NAD-dependent epimerase/dehydratase family protein [Candidatus Korobacteraceae bacterium]